MVRIVLDNVYAKVIGVDHDTEMKIWNALSFEVEDFQGIQTRRRHLYNRKTKKTYTGLISYVEEILNNLDIEYQIVDNRVRPEPNADFKLVDRINTVGDNEWVKLEARPYQKTIIDNALPREVLQAATGAGKTFIMAGLVARFNVKPVLVFADKLSLVNQIRDEFTRFLGDEIGIIGGGMREVRDITVCSVQSMLEEDELLADAKMIMFDECLTYDSLILMEDGTYEKIGKLVEEKSKKRVMSYNHKTGRIEPKAIINHSKTPLRKGNKKLMRIKIRKSNERVEVITCTDNHKIWVEDMGKYVMAKDLIKGQTVGVLNEHTKTLTLIKGVIEAIEFVDMSEDEYDETYVYDIGVEDNHNFLAENVLVHNCHHIPSATMSEVARKAVNAYYRIGVSATPWRDTGDDMLIEAVLAKRRPEYAITASKLIDMGYLVPCTIYFVPMKQVFKGNNYHTIYKKAIVDNDQRNETIVKIAYKMYETRGATTLILIQQVRHGELLQDMLSKVIPMESFTVSVEDPKTRKAKLVRVRNVEFLSGQDDPLRRKAVIQATKEKKVKVLIGSTIADEGLDISSLDCLILAGGGKSSTRAFQRIGRVLRLHKDPITGREKKRAIVFDFIDYTPTLRRHSRIRQKLYMTEERWEIKYFNTNLLTK